MNVMEGLLITENPTLPHPEEAFVEPSVLKDGSTRFSGGSLIKMKDGFSWLALPLRKCAMPQPNQENHQRYVHDSLPLGHVRFLAQVAQSDPEVLAFKFISMSLESAKDKYIAVSYCWGIGPTSEFILADGLFIPAPEKARDHLIYLCSRRSAEFFGLSEPDMSIIWIDSLCINQADEIEKAQQIQLMGMIYHNATSVEIILDSGKASEDVMMDSIRSRSMYGTVAQDFTESFGWLVPPFSKQAIRELLWSPWFSRAWVVQEFCFARAHRFHYRGIFLPLEFLLEICEYGLKNGYVYVIGRNGRMEAIQPVMVQNFDTLLNHRYQLQEHLKNPDRSRILDTPYGFPLEDVLCSFFNLKASDPRDKIFAMLNLATGKCPIEPNYNHDAGFIYLDTMLSLFNCGTDYALFGFAGLAAQKPLFEGVEVNSWLPDFNTPPTHRTWSNKFKYFNASGVTRLGCAKPMVTVLFPSSLPKMKRGTSCPYVEQPTWAVGVFGICLGTVTCIVKGEPESNVAHRQEFITGARKLVQSLPPDCSTALASHVFIKTLIAENQEFMELSDIETGLVEISKIFETFDRDPTKAKLTESALSKSYLNAWLSEGGGRTRGMFKTDTNYIGLAANAVEPGDEVWLLVGARVPFVFRGPLFPVVEATPAADPTPEVRGSYAYQLVSEAYVYGIMRGELETNIDKVDLVALI